MKEKGRKTEVGVAGQEYPARLKPADLNEDQFSCIG